MTLFIFPLRIKRLAEKTKSWHGTCNYIGMDRKFDKRTVAQSGSDSSLQKGISRLTLSHKWGSGSSLQQGMPRNQIPNRTADKAYAWSINEQDALTGNGEPFFNYSQGENKYVIL